jgi:maltose O-acetyltransferase
MTAKTELEKMLAGEMYEPTDPQLVRRRERAHDLCWALNATSHRATSLGSAR